MNKELRELKKQAKEIGINTNNFKVNKSSVGEYQISQYGVILAEGYNVTDCRIYAIQCLIDEAKEIEEIFNSDEEKTQEMNQTEINSQFQLNDLNAIQAILDSSSTMEYKLSQIKTITSIY